jgi:hypothetical protein
MSQPGTAASTSRWIAWRRPEASCTFIVTGREGCRVFKVLANKAIWDDNLANAKMLRPALEQVEGFVVSKHAAYREMEISIKKDWSGSSVEFETFPVRPRPIGRPAGNRQGFENQPPTQTRRQIDFCMLIATVINPLDRCQLS